MRKLIFTALVMLSACKSRQERMAEVMDAADRWVMQEKEIDGLKLRLQYLPPGVANGDSSELCFRLKITAEDPSRPFSLDGQQFSYGVDTLFGMVINSDTLKPMMAMRIANGKLTGAEYMIVFDKAAVGHAGNSFLFRDWLFTRRELSFPIDIIAINRIDSLSARI